MAVLNGKKREKPIPSRMVMDYLISLLFYQTLFSRRKRIRLRQAVRWKTQENAKGRKLSSFISGYCNSRIDRPKK